jgi:hypothetical protein
VSGFFVQLFIHSYSGLKHVIGYMFQIFCHFQSRSCLTVMLHSTFIHSTTFNFGSLIIRRIMLLLKLVLNHIIKGKLHFVFSIFVR